MAPADNLRSAAKPPLFYKPVTFQQPVTTKKPLRCPLCLPTKTKIYVNSNALQDHLASSVHRKQNSLPPSPTRMFKQEEVPVSDEVKSTTSGEMMDMDSSTDRDSSDDEEYSSDGVEIITDTMGSPTFAVSEPKKLLPRDFKIPTSRIAKMAPMSWDTERYHHNNFFMTDTSDGRAGSVHAEEIRTTPLFSADVLACTLRQNTVPGADDLLPAYGLLAKVLQTFGEALDQEQLSPLGSSTRGLANVVDAMGDPVALEDKRIFVNMNAPWSAFICGSQGSGKSHTLSCMLENALISSRMGRLQQPLAGIVFHYDKFTGFTSTQICEAAYLASSGIPVKVLVSPSNRWRMEKAYSNLPGFPTTAKKPVVVPLFLNEKQLNVERMMKLMAVDEKDGRMALYMESVCRILRSMAEANQGAPGLDFELFTRRLDLETLNDTQKAMLGTRLQLLKSFLHIPQKPGTGILQQKKPQFTDNKKGHEQERKWWAEEDARARARVAKSDIWSFEPGTLTIVDLSCPFVDEGAACAMFNISLALFLEDRAKAGRIVALDEAHKFMTATNSSSQFTESLLSVIRQQRHLATRVIIATQEPTISPALLDLSSMTIVHRFTSPAWLTALKNHLAGVLTEGDGSKRDVNEIFRQIVNLDAGQALLFCPSAMLGMDNRNSEAALRMKKMGTGYIKIQVRNRMTADGGRSILAT